jgi:Spy/CpxP family protein refolding chaperone
MRNSVIKYILVVSLLMNLSLLGAAAYTHYKQVHSYRTAPFLGPSSTPGPLAPFGPGMFFEELSLKPEQVKFFQQKAQLFHGGLLKKSEEMNRLRVSLVALMRADNPDNKTIEATIAQINQKQEEMQRTIVSHMIEFKSMLNKDQQKKFMDMIENAMGEQKEAVCPY